MGREAVMKSIKIIGTLIVLSFLITRANPVIPIVINELKFNGEDWVIETGTMVDLEGTYLKTNTDSAYFKDSLCVDETFCLITNEDMKSDLYINPAGDTLMVMDTSGFMPLQLTFGAKGEIATPAEGQSICAMRDIDEDIVYYLDNTPTLGNENDTLNATGNVTGVVTDTLDNPLADVEVIYDIDYPQAAVIDTSSVFTGEDGNFIFRRIAARTNLIFSKEGFPSDTLTLQVHPDSTVNLDTVRLKGVVTSVETDAVAAEFSLEQNFPNPFNPETTIKYKIPRGTNYQLVQTTLKIYDILGNEVRTLVNKQHTPGSYEITFHAGNLPSSVYLYQLKAGEFEEVKKMVLAK